MLRYSSARTDEPGNMGSRPHSGSMRAIPSMYFRASSPHRSRASTSLPGMQPIPIQLQVPSVRSSASSAASNRSEKDMGREINREKEKGHEHDDKGDLNEREKEKRGAPIAPVMRRAETSSSTSTSTSSSSASSRGYNERTSYYYRQEQPPPSPTSRRRRTSVSISTLPNTPPPSSSPSRTRSRRQSINQTQGPKPNQYPTVSRKDKLGDDYAYSDVRNNGNSSHADSIPHLREALSSLESQMANLQFERQRLETKLEHAVRQQVPVHRLPRELLGRIFDIGVHRADAEEDVVLLSTLMRVCKTWTDVALNTPVLWSRILIDSPASLPKARRKLTRSRAVPLDITIQFGPLMDPEESTSPLRGSSGPGGRGRGKGVIETVVHAMDLLQPALWRWRSFRLAVPTHAHAAAALSQCTDPAPLLEVLAVQVHHVMYDAVSRSSNSSRSHRAAPLSLNVFMDDLDDAGAQLFGGHTPRLRKCALTSFDAGWGGPLMRGLTTLRLGGFWNGAAPGIRALVEVLRNCPMLEELALRNMSDVENDSSSAASAAAAGGSSSSSSNSYSYNESCACYDFDGSGSVKSNHQSHSHSHSRSAYPRESDMVHLARLKSASFYYSGAVRTAGLLARMSFPSLERLELSYIDNLAPILTHLKRQACTLPTVDFPEWSTHLDAEAVDEVRVGGGIGRGGDEWRMMMMKMRMKTGLPLKVLRIESCLFNELKLVRLLRRLPMLRTLELVDVEDISASFLNGLSTPYQNAEWICPLLDTLSFDGCSALTWDVLRTLVESRLPPEDSASARLLGPGMAARSKMGGLASSASASAYAAAARQRHSTSSSASASASSNSNGPSRCSRLRVLDLTRCPQISNEMIAWLRMYVSEVRVRRECETTYWGEFGFGFGHGGGVGDA